MGAYQGFIDGATGSAVAIDRRREIEAAHFDAIVGATVPSASARTAGASTKPAAPTSSARPVATGARPAPAKTASRRNRPAAALGVFAALSVAGVVLGAGVIVAADALVHGPLTSPTSVLAGARSADTVTPVAADGRKASPFGSTVALGDDLAVSISAPTAYSPSSRATGADDAADVVSVVTITNVGSGDVDPAVAFTVTGTSGTRIFDRPNGIRLNATHTIAAGQSVTYRVAFSVGAVAGLRVQVSSGGSSVLIGD